MNRCSKSEGRWLWPQKCKGILVSGSHIWFLPRLLGNLVQDGCLNECDIVHHTAQGERENINSVSEIKQLTPVQLINEFNSIQFNNPHSLIARRVLIYNPCLAKIWLSCYFAHVIRRGTQETEFLVAALLQETRSTLLHVCCVSQVLWQNPPQNTLFLVALHPWA